VFGSNCVLVMFSLITSFPSLTRHSPSRLQARPELSIWTSQGVSTTNSIVSSQRLYYCHHNYHIHCFRSAILSTCPRGNALIVSYQPVDTTPVSDVWVDTTLVSVLWGYAQQSCYVETIRTVQPPNDSCRKSDGGTTENC
jgi:hypothetical protein